jgi:hypothetical protein
MNTFFTFHALLLASAGFCAAAGQAVPRVPVLEGEPWDICVMPDLGALKGPVPHDQHIVDHGFLLRPDGKWTLWACIRGTAAGRILYGWEGDSLTEGPWRPLGVTAQADPLWGENAAGPNPESGTVPGTPQAKAPRWRGAVIQAPYFLKWGDEFLCFYNSNGIRVMTSRDGKTFTRRGTPPDGNLLYADGGRDVMVLPVGGVLHAYSTISTTDRRGYIMLRTSTDLKNWTPGKNVNEGGPGGRGPVSAESPFVVALDGYFYLFRASSEDGKTYVYRSLVPDDFGVNDNSKLVATLKLKAPEVIQHEGRWFISDLGSFQALKLRRLRWDSQETDSRSNANPIQPGAPSRP